MDDAADYSSDVEEDATEPPTTAVVEQHASAVVAYDSIVGDVEQLEANFRALHLEAKRARDVLRAPSEYYLQPKWKREAFSGDQMLQGLFDCLARFDQSQFRRSREQVEMHLMWAQVRDFCPSCAGTTKSASAVAHAITGVPAADLRARVPEQGPRAPQAIWGPLLLVFCGHLCHPTLWQDVCHGCVICDDRPCVGAHAPAQLCSWRLFSGRKSAA